MTIQVKLSVREVEGIQDIVGRTLSDKDYSDIEAKLAEQLEAEASDLLFEIIEEDYDV